MQSRLGCLATALALAFSLPGLARAQRAAAIADVLVSPSDAQVQVGGATQLFAAAFDRAGNALTSVTSFTWSSSNPRVAKIDANGVATGLSPGVTLITARLGSGRSVKTSQPATLEVLGESAAPQPQPQRSVYPPIRILISTPRDTLITLTTGARAYVGARFLRADSVPVEGVDARWDVSDSSVVRFDPTTGMLEALRMGYARLKVSAQTDRADSIFRRWNVRVAGGGLQIATPRFALPVGERRPLAVQLLDAQRHPLGTATDLRWRSSDTLVARVVGGSAVAVGMGHARLVAYASWDSTVAADVYVVGDMIVAGLSDGMWNLYMAQSRGGARPRTLTRDSALKFAPTWSAGLTRIAYIVEPDPRILVSDLWVANVDGSGARRLTDDSARVASPSFVGPSGDRIVFASARGGLPQLYIVNLDGTARRALTTGEDPSMDPDVSPDGAKLLYASERDRNGDIYEMNLDGTGERRLTTDTQYEDSPVYAPDGKSFYYIRHESSSPPSSRVFRQDLATGVAVPVTPGGILVRAFSVSADGRTLAITVIMLDSHAVPHVELLDLLTGTRAPLMLPGVEQMAGAAFRPPVPAPH